MRRGQRHTEVEVAWAGFKELKTRFSLSESTIRRLIEAGRWPCGRYLGGRRLFSVRQCDEAFERLLVDRVAGVVPPEAS